MAITGPALVVLVFNLRGQVFLGDCGTFGVGFIIAMLALGLNMARLFNVDVEAKKAELKALGEPASQVIGGI